MTFLSIVGVAGNIARPSRTAALLSAILAEITALQKAQSRVIELVDVGQHLFQPFVPERLQSFALERLPPEARSAIQAIELADALVVATPVYKGSYSGALKHLFDLVRAERTDRQAGAGGCHRRQPAPRAGDRTSAASAVRLLQRADIADGDLRARERLSELPDRQAGAVARVKRAAAEFVELLEAQSGRRRQAASATA